MKTLVKYTQLLKPHPQKRWLPQLPFNRAGGKPTQHLGSYFIYSSFFKKMNFAEEKNLLHRTPQKKVWQIEHTEIFKPDFSFWKINLYHEYSANSLP